MQTVASAAFTAQYGNKSPRIRREDTLGFSDCTIPGWWALQNLIHVWGCVLLEHAHHCHAWAMVMLQKNKWKSDTCYNTKHYHGYVQARPFRPQSRKHEGHVAMRLKWPESQAHSIRMHVKNLHEESILSITLWPPSSMTPTYWWTYNKCKYGRGNKRTTPFKHKHTSLVHTATTTSQRRNNTVQKEYYRT